MLLGEIPQAKQQRAPAEASASGQRYRQHAWRHDLGPVVENGIVAREQRALLSTTHFVTVLEHRLQAVARQLEPIEAMLDGRRIEELRQRLLLCAAPSRLLWFAACHPPLVAGGRAFKSASRVT